MISPRLKITVKIPPNNKKKKQRTDMINSGKTFNTDTWNEKITDAINYLFLLKGLVTDTGRSTNKKIKNSKSSNQKIKKEKIKKSVILNEERK